MKRLVPAAMLIGACFFCAPAQETKPGAKNTEEARRVHTTSGLGELIDIPIPGDSTIGFTANFSYTTDGGRVAMSPHVVLGFDAQELKNNRLGKSDIISIVVDEMPILISTDLAEFNPREDIAWGSIEPGGEWVEVAIPRNEFARLVKAKAVRVQLGPLAFSLSGDNLRALRGLASRMSSVEKQAAK